MNSFRLRIHRTALLASAALALTALVSVPAVHAASPLKPNLRGGIMILVYHRFGDKDGRWRRSWSGFDQDLARLEADGYRPITLHQYASGDFQTPLGTTPIVITFDDSTAGQIRFDAQGHLAPNCMLAHWEKFARNHPDFPVRPVFFVNSGLSGKAAFRQPKFAQKKLQLVVQLGGEIGNHTLTHANLKKDAALVRREIGLGQYDIQKLLPGYHIYSFALPFGIYPQPDSLSWQGNWKNNNPRLGPPEVSWHYESVVKVGSGPAPSPFVKGFDPHHLPRLQVFTDNFDKGPNLNRMLAFYERHPQYRFVSDGQKHALGSLPRRK